MPGQYNILSEKYDLILEMNRRKFLQTGIKGAAAAGIMPGAAGKAIGNIVGGVPNATAAAANNFIPDNVLMSFLNLGSFANLKKLKGTNPLQRIELEKNNLEYLSDVLSKQTGEVPESLNAVINVLNTGINALTNKLTPDQKKYLNSLEINKMSVDDIYNMMVDELEGFEGELDSKVLGPLFKTNKISPQLQKYIEDKYEIYKCEFVKDPESRARKNEKMRIEDEKIQKRRKETQDFLQRIKDKEDYHGSRFDRAGGSEDTYDSGHSKAIAYDPEFGEPVKVYGGPGTYTVDENQDILAEKYITEIAISPDQDPKLNELLVRKAKIQLFTVIDALLDAGIIGANGNYDKPDGTVGILKDVIQKIGDAKDGYELDQVWNDSQIGTLVKSLTDPAQ